MFACFVNVTLVVFLAINFCSFFQFIFFNIYNENTVKKVKEDDLEFHI